MNSHRKVTTTSDYSPWIRGWCIGRVQSHRNLLRIVFSSLINLMAPRPALSWLNIGSTTQGHQVPFIRSVHALHSARPAIAPSGIVEYRNSDHPISSADQYWLRSRPLRRLEEGVGYEQYVIQRRCFGDR